MIGVMSALVFAASWIQFMIPTPVDNTRLHLGNVMCLLSGFLLGPVPGGLAAGFGSLFYDLTNPLYVAESPITFIMKFAMGWLCGKIAWSGNMDTENITGKKIPSVRMIIAGISGAIFYVILYLTKNFIYYKFFLRMEDTPMLISLGQKGIVSLINGVLAVVIAVPLAMTLRAARVGILKAKQPNGSSN